MNIITIAEYTAPDGIKRSAVQYGDAQTPLTPERPDWQSGARDYARAVYHQERAPKRLQHWNGDTGEMSTMDSTS